MENKSNSIKSIFLFICIIGVVLFLAFDGLSLFSKKIPEDDPIIETKITINFSLKGNKEISIARGSTYTDPGFKAIGSDGKDYSDNVTVSGNVDTNKVGRYIITYTLSVPNNNKKLTRTVNVVNKDVPVTSIKTSKDNYSIEVGELVVIKATVEPKNATNKNLKWSSSNNNIVKVSNGRIQGVNKGTANIIIKDSSGKVSKTVKVTVKEKVTITFALKGNKNITLTVGTRFTDPGFKATGSDGKDYSSNVSISGNVDTNKVGKYTLTYKLKVGSTEKKLTRTINVVENNIPVTAIKTDKDSYSVYIGNSILVKTTIEPSNATNKTLTWTSSDPSIATVSNGSVKGLKAGTVTIKIEDSTKKVSKEVKVTVKKKPVASTTEKIHFIKQSVSTTAAGDAILLESNGHFAMIDTGLSDATDQKYVYDYLKSVGVKKLDFVLITHNHNDHIGGFVYLADKLPVGKLYIKTYLGKDSKSSTNKTRYNNAINKANEKKIPITYIDKSFTDGKGFVFQDMTINLYNTSQVIHDNENGNTVLEFVKTNGYRILLTGDFYSYSDNVAYMLNLSKKSEFQNLDILKIPHHGYGSCAFKNSKKAANNMNPKYLIITGGAKVCDGVFSSKIPRYYVKSSSKNAVVVTLGSSIKISS